MPSEWMRWVWDMEDWQAQRDIITNFE